MSRAAVRRKQGHAALNGRERDIQVERLEQFVCHELAGARANFLAGPPLLDWLGF
jgi:hypothetical protein